MSRRRIPRGTILLTVALAAVAIGAPSARASTTQALVLSTLRSDAGDTWRASGAFEDAGSFSDDPGFFAGRSSTFHVFRTFTGAGGTFTVRGDVRIVPTSDPLRLDVTGRWAVVTGTGEYEALHGGGQITEVIDMSVGQLSGTWTGTVIV
jgi:hypothetical protein